MKTGAELKWRIVYNVGERNAVAFLFAVSADEAKKKITDQNPGAVVTLVVEDKRDP